MKPCRFCLEIYNCSTLTVDFFKKLPNFFNELDVQNKDNEVLCKFQWASKCNM